MPKILVFSPLALNMSCGQFNISWAYTSLLLAQAGHTIELVHQGSSNIVVSRNKAVGMVLNSDHTHLLFLDSDMSWDQPDAVLRMLSLDRPIICGGYLSKSAEPFWTFRVKGGGRLEDIRPDTEGLIELTHAPTGFMLIRRDVLEQIAEERPDLKCNFNSALPPEEPGHYLMFDQRFSRDRIESDDCPKGIRHYTTDDFGFSETWTDMGGRLWLYPWITIHHWRMAPVSGNVAHTLMSLGIPLPAAPAPLEANRDQ